MAAETTTNRSTLTTIIMALMCVVLVAGVSLFGVQCSESPPPAGMVEVSMTVQTSPDVEKHYQVQVPDGSTVLETMNAAQANDSSFTFVTSGGGDKVLVKSILGFMAEGMGPEAKNWTYLVNGELAPKGAAEFTVSDGDAIVWRFGVFVGSEMFE